MKLLWTFATCCMFLTMPAAAHDGHAEGAGFHLLSHLMFAQDNMLYLITFICIAGLAAFVKSMAAAQK